MTAVIGVLLTRAITIPQFSPYSDMVLQAIGRLGIRSFRTHTACNRVRRSTSLCMPSDIMARNGSRNKQLLQAFVAYLVTRQNGSAIVRLYRARVRFRPQSFCRCCHWCHYHITVTLRNLLRGLRSTSQGTRSTLGSLHSIMGSLPCSKGQFPLAQHRVT